VGFCKLISSFVMGLFVCLQRGGRWLCSAWGRKKRKDRMFSLFLLCINQGTIWRGAGFFRGEDEIEMGF